MVGGPPISAVYPVNGSGHRQMRGFARKLTRGVLRTATASDLQQRPAIRLTIKDETDISDRNGRSELLLNCNVAHCCVID